MIRYNSITQNYVYLYLFYVYMSIPIFPQHAFGWLNNFGVSQDVLHSGDELIMINERDARRERPGPTGTTEKRRGGCSRRFRSFLMALEQGTYVENIWKCMENVLWKYIVEIYGKYNRKLYMENHHF